MACFTVPAGHCAGSYDGVLLSTDLEPDDAVAILALSSRLRGVPLLVVVGEGPNDKRQMAAELLACFGLDEHATILQGRRSNSSWPETVTTCYHDHARSPQHRAKIIDGEGDAHVLNHVATFLSACTSPFALLLKPPHEMLKTSEELRKRCVSALYGSFNLKVLRDGMLVSEPELAEAAQYERQWAFLLSFKAMLWVERSESVGRDSVLDPIVSPAVWPAIDARPPLMEHIQLWSADTLRSFGLKLSTLDSRIAEALGTSADAAAPTTVFGAEQYDKADSMVARAEKHVTVMRSITTCRGKQVRMQRRRIRRRRRRHATIATCRHAAVRALHTPR